MLRYTKYKVLPDSLIILPFEPLVLPTITSPTWKEVVAEDDVKVTFGTLSIAAEPGPVAAGLL